MARAPIHTIYAVTSHDIDTAIFHVASALQIPVLILALLALAAVIYELGSYAVEVRGRRGRRFSILENRTERACLALNDGDRLRAGIDLEDVARSATMAETLSVIVGNARTARSEHRPQ